MFETLNTQFKLFDLLLLIGMIQGVITSVLLLFTNKNIKANKFLAFAILFFCLLSVKMLLNTMGLTQTQYFRYFPLGIELAIAPLVYFYIVALITPEFKFRYKDIFHFLPFVISQSYAFFVYFSVVAIPTIEAKDVIGGALKFEQVKQLEDYLALLSIISYLSISFVKLKKYRQQLKDTISDNTFPTFSWLLKIFILSTVLGLFLLINLLLDVFLNLKESHNIHWQAYFIYIAVLIYYLGFVGYLQPDFDISGIQTSSKEPEKSNLSEAKISQLKQDLKYQLEINKVFLEPKLSLLDLAKILATNQSSLSHVINSCYNKNFRDLINEYRINQVKQKLQDSSNQHLSYLAIALESGFNSEASFYRVFKKSTGITPKEYSKTFSE